MLAVWKALKLVPSFRHDFSQHLHICVGRAHMPFNVNWLTSNVVSVLVLLFTTYVAFFCKETEAMTANIQCTWTNTEERVWDDMLFGCEHASHRLFNNRWFFHPRAESLDLRFALFQRKTPEQDVQHALPVLQGTVLTTSWKHMSQRFGSFGMMPTCYYVRRYTVLLCSLWTLSNLISRTFPCDFGSLLLIRSSVSLCLCERIENRHGAILLIVRECSGFNPRRWRHCGSWCAGQRTGRLWQRKGGSER